MRGVLFAACLAAGCTPRMHAGYRATVTMAGVAAQVVDTRMTQWAVAHGSPETHPLLGNHPSAALLAAGGTTGASLMIGWHELVQRLPDKGPETEWVRDILATLPLIIEGYSVGRNLGTIGTDWRQW